MHQLHPFGTEISDIRLLICTKDNANRVLRVVPLMVNVKLSTLIMALALVGALVLAGSDSQCQGLRGSRVCGRASSCTALE